MIVLKLPKNPYKGIKLFCKTCRVDNPKCNHYDKIIYRVRVHIPGTKNEIKSKMLVATNYDDAVLESIQFEKELISNSYTTVVPVLDQGNDYSVVDAIIKYNQYLNGESEYAHLKKNVTKGHSDEMIRYCTYFAQSLKKKRDIERMRIVDVSKQDVSDFYTWASNHYAPKTFNKCLNSTRVFFDFLIDIEEIVMKNPFRFYTRKSVQSPNIETITKDEFESILSAVDTIEPVMVLGGIGEKKNLYRPYLKDGYKLFLLTGGRREEVVDLKWNDIYETKEGVKFFMINNLKVERIINSNNSHKKYFPINEDLNQFLLEMGYNEKKYTSDYILFPERKVKSITIMNDLSKSFTHYKNGAGITKDISLKTLRKTYISWANQVMGNETGLLTSHSNNSVIEKYYLDPKILSVIEMGALKIRVFGENSSRNSSRKKEKGPT